METAAVRKRVAEAIDRARRRAGERRSRADDAARDYAAFLENVAVPLFRQVSNVLKAAGYPFSVFTPSGGVRLMSDRSADDYIDLSLDTSGEQPMVLGHSRRRRGNRIVEHEHAVGEQTVAHLTEEALLEYLLKEIEPFVER
jgi:hypothetical protein